MAGSLKKEMRQWLDKVALRNLPTLQSNSRIREIDTDDAQNKYGYLYNVYYLEDPAQPPVGVVFHKEKFHQFYHSTTTGRPYLGALHNQANNFELFEDNSSMEAGADNQLTLQIHHSVVAIDQGQLGSLERAREPWAPASTPTITASTYTPQQTQPGVQMATETITRTLTGEAQHETTGESLPAEGSRRGLRSVPFGSDQLGTSRPSEDRIRASIINAFWRCLQRDNGGGPPGDDDNDLGGYGPPGGGGPPNEDPNGDLQDHVPISPALKIRAMGSLPRIFDRDRTKADTFLTEFLRYLMLNHGVPGLESPIRQVALALTLIKGEKVDL